MLNVRVAGVGRTPDGQVPVAAVDEHRVESQETPVTCASDGTLDQLAVALLEEPVYDLHLRDEPLGVRSQVRLPLVGIDGEVPRNRCALRERHRDIEQENRDYQSQ